MTRHQPDPEDLLRDAIALVQRIKLRVAECDTTFVIGFRRDGSVSCYVDNDELFYQFDTNNSLRRAHWRGLIVKPESGSLVGLRRQMTAGRVAFAQEPLDAIQVDALLHQQKSLFDRLRQAMRVGDVEILGQVPDEVDIADRVHRWLAQQCPDATP